MQRPTAGATVDSSTRAAAAERERAVVGAALFAFLLAFTVDLRLFAWDSGVGAGGATCPHEPFYAPSELPLVHEIELHVEKAPFTAMVGRMWDRNQPELPLNISFNGVVLEGAKVQLHGGPFQRGQRADQVLSLSLSRSLSLSLSLSVSVSPLSLLSLWYPLSLSLVTSLTHYPTLFARVAYSIAI